MTQIKYIVIYDSSVDNTPIPIVVTDSLDDAKQHIKTSIANQQPRTRNLSEIVVELNNDDPQHQKYRDVFAPSIPVAIFGTEDLEGNPTSEIFIIIEVPSICRS